MYDHPPSRAYHYDLHIHSARVATLAKPSMVTHNVPDPSHPSHHHSTRRSERNERGLVSSTAPPTTNNRQAPMATATLQLQPPEPQQSHIQSQAAHRGYIRLPQPAQPRRTYDQTVQSANAYDHHDNNDEGAGAEDEQQSAELEGEQENNLKGKARAAGERPSEQAGGSAMPPLGPAMRRVGGARIKGACEGCKLAKVKCELSSWARNPDARNKPTMCKRCVASSTLCVVPNRKVKKPPPRHEELEQQLSEKDDKIARLLEDLYITSFGSSAGNSNPSMQPSSASAHPNPYSNPNTYGASQPLQPPPHSLPNAYSSQPQHQPYFHPYLHAQHKNPYPSSSTNPYAYNPNVNTSMHATTPTIAITTPPSRGPEPPTQPPRPPLQPPQPQPRPPPLESTQHPPPGPATQPQQQPPPRIYVDPSKLNSLVACMPLDKKLSREEKERQTEQWIRDAVTVFFPQGSLQVLGHGHATPAVTSTTAGPTITGRWDRRTSAALTADAPTKEASSSEGSCRSNSISSQHQQQAQQAPLDALLAIAAAAEGDHVSENGDKVWANPPEVEEEMHVGVAGGGVGVGVGEWADVPGGVGAAARRGAAAEEQQGDRTPTQTQVGSGSVDKVRAGVPQQRLPEILREGLVDMKLCVELFNIYYDKINMIGFSVCDPTIHTPERVLQTSSFLFTTICAVASRHYTANLGLSPLLLAAARRAAATAVSGPKSVETCQAYMILGTFSPPSRQFSEDRAYLFIGMALRVASELMLHLPRYTHPPPAHLPEPLARALLNRGRAWLNCYCTDRSIAVQTGKPSAIVFIGAKAGGPLPFDVRTWWRCSKWNLPQDFWVCAYADLLRALAGFHDLVFSADAYESDGSKKALDLETISSYAAKVDTIQRDWLELKNQYFPHRTDPRLTWRDELWPFISSYLKLVVVSVGLREGMKKGMKQDNPFSDACIKAAAAVLRQVVDVLAKLGYMKYFPEAWFIFTGFAAAFIFKILRPRFSFMINPSLAKELVTLLERLIDLFGSDSVAISDRHTPKLYARFLDGLLTEYKEGKAGGKASPKAKSNPKVESRSNVSAAVATNAGTGATSANTIAHAGFHVPVAEAEMTFAPMQMEPIMYAARDDSADADAYAYQCMHPSGLGGSQFQQTHSTIPEFSSSSRSTAAWPPSHDPSTSIPMYSQQGQHSPGTQQTFQPSPTHTTYQPMQPTPETQYSSFSHNMDVDQDFTNSQSYFWTVPIPQEFVDSGYTFPTQSVQTHSPDRPPQVHSSQLFASGGGTGGMHPQSAALIHQGSHIGAALTTPQPGEPGSGQVFNSGPGHPSMLTLSVDSRFWEDGAMPGYYDMGVPYQPR